METKRRIMESILGGIVETELSNEAQQTILNNDMSLDYSLDFIYNEFIKDSITKNETRESFSNVKRDFLLELEKNYTMLKSSLDEEARSKLDIRWREVYLNILELFENKYKFCSLENLGVDPENWSNATLKQNVQSLYELLVVNRFDTIVSYLTGRFKLYETEIIEQLQNKYKKRNARTKNNQQDIPATLEALLDQVTFNDLKEIIEEELSTDISMKQFYEGISADDEGELTASIVYSLVDDDNEDFFSELVRPYVTDETYFIPQITVNTLLKWQQ